MISQIEIRQNLYRKGEAKRDRSRLRETLMERKLDHETACRPPADIDLATTRITAWQAVGSALIIVSFVITAYGMCVVIDWAVKACVRWF